MRWALCALLGQVSRHCCSGPMEGSLSPQAQSQMDGSSDRALIDDLCCAHKEPESSTVPFVLVLDHSSGPRSPGPGSDNY